MESSVASRNPFDLLSENPITESQQAKSSQKKQTKPSTKDNAAPRPGPQGTRYPARGGYRNVVHVDSSSDASFDRRRRGGPRSERGRGATRGGRRAFDRHSGTGLVDSEKKTTQGWLGKDNVTVADGEKAAEDAQKDQDAAGAETPVENAVEEEEDNTLTLEQYYKERAAKLLSDTKEARKANQGVTIDASQLKESVTVSKEEEEFFSATAGSKARKNKQQKEKVHVAIEQRFNQQESRRGGRGGHRDNRFGPGSRRQNRSKPIDISSSADFPAL